MKNRKKTIWAVIALILAAAVLVCLYLAFRPDTQQGAKTVTVEVVHGDGSSKEFVYRTDEEYLGALLQSEGLIVGEDGPYGLYVTEVDGEVADYSVNSSWWALHKDGELLSTGVSETPIADGDRFQWVYTIG